jgi:L-alanine-DL-glutamate epimerase-like enolase superfamily enzyme
MFQISDSAEKALRQIRLENGIPPDAAVRIGPIETDDGEVGIGYAFTGGPEGGDQKISDVEDFQVYLTEELAASLNEAALELTANEEGITLQLRTQEQLNGSAKQA